MARTKPAPGSIASKVALIYLALGLIWIFGSDLYLYYFSEAETPFPLVELAKGSAFVIVSALVIYLLVFWQERAGRVEQLRRQSAERGYRALIESTPDAVLILDPDTGTVFDANEAAERLFDRPREQLIGLERAAHTDTADPAFQTYLDERRRSGRARAEMQMIRADGSRFPADVSSAVFHDHEGRLRASVIVRDISERQAREQALEASEERLSELTNLQQAVLNSVFAHIAVLDAQGVVQFANARWQTAVKSGELPELGADAGADYLALCDEFQGPEYETARRIAAALRDVLGGRSRHEEFEFPYSRGEVRHWSRLAVTPFTARGENGVVLVHLDVTDRREAETRMRLVNAAFHSTDEAILICDDNFMILDANDAYLRITGFDRDDALASKPPFLEIGDQARQVGKALAREGHWKGDLLQRRADGESFVSLAAVDVVEQVAGEPQRLVITFSDVSELREVEQRLGHLSYHDPITNLPNRNALVAWFIEERSRAKSARSGALIYIDLDRFKFINESFGHDMGDELLRKLASRLKALTGPRDQLARLGGDEFLVIADGVESDQDAVRHAQRLLDAVAEPMTLGSRELFTTASAGISLYPRDGLSLEELLREADAALHQVKAEGRRGGISVFQHEMKQDVDRRMRVERGLRFAVERDELELEFQPVIRLADGVLCGAEALVRWNNPELGRLLPDQFIPAAEDTGLIAEIGHWVLERACRQARLWHGMSTRFEHLSVNISAIQFQQPGLVEQVGMVLKRHGLAGGMLRLEITESVVMRDPDLAIELLGRLRALDVGIAIDDFGTGQSSLTYLRTLPVQYLKLDKSFIARLPDDQTNLKIMRAVIELAHQLGIRVVAEGIETEDQYRLLVEWGCDEGQGFLMARPMAAGRLEALLRDGDIRLGAGTGQAQSKGE